MADTGLIAGAVDVMTTLNAAASAQAAAAGASAATDVTGFGLVGHATSSRWRAVYPSESTRRRCRASRGRWSSRRTPTASPAAAAATRATPPPSPASAAGSIPFARSSVADAMTSGGLLIAVAASRANEISGTVVGELLDGDPGTIEVT